MTPQQVEKVRGVLHEWDELERQRNDILWKLNHPRIWMEDHLADDTKSAVMIIFEAGCRTLIDQIDKMQASLIICGCQVQETEAVGPRKVDTSEG